MQKWLKPLRKNIAETISAIWDFTAGLKADTISESTADTGVTCDGVLLKDGTISADQVTEGTNKFVTAAQKTNLDNIVDTGRKNLVVDGTLKYWMERITATNPVTATYIHTLWQAKHLKSSGTRPTMTLSRQALTAGVSLVDYALRIAASGADSSLDADSYYLLRHYIYHGTRNHSNGRKITVSFKVASSVADQKIGVVLRQNYGTTGSPSSEEILTGKIFTLASGVNSISKTFTTNSLTGKTYGTENNDCLIVDIVVQCGSTVATSLFADSAFGFTEATTLDLYEFGTYEGEVAYPFVVSDDKLEILSFFKKSYTDETVIGSATWNGATGSLTAASAGALWGLLFVDLIPPMKKTPAVTLYDVAGAINKITNYTSGGGGSSVGRTGAIFSGINNYRFGVFGIADETKTGIAFHFVADARY